MNNPQGPSTQRVLLNTFKWIFGICMILSGIGVIFTKTLFGGVLLLIGGIMLLPFISKFLIKKTLFWQERIVRIVITTGILILGLMILGINVSPKFSNLKTTRSEVSSDAEEELPYQNYLNQTEDLIKSLPKERLQNRNNALAELQKNTIYEKLVINQEVSPEYLVLLNAISRGITYTKDDEFAVEDSIYSKIQKSDNGEDKIMFVTRVIGLALPTNGGLTNEFIDLFERYKNRFR